MKRLFRFMTLLCAVLLTSYLAVQAHALERTPDIQKDVGAIGDNSASFDIGQSHTWIIRGDVPEGIGKALVYEISDVLNYRLTYERNSPVVTLYTRAGTELRLKREQHYILTEAVTEDEGRIVDSLSVSLTSSGMEYVAEHLGTGELRPEIRVYFRASINSSTSMGSTIPNDAHLLYINEEGEEFRVDSDIPEVHTGGINLINQDNEGSPLPGAVFLLARDATRAELERDYVLKDVLFVNGKDHGVVYVDFYTQRDMSGKKSDRVGTNEAGEACLYGLAYGTYYLVQIQGPEGYDALPEPIAVQINETSHLRAQDGWRTSEDQLVDNTRHILQSPFVIPNTGDRGIYGFVLMGIASLFTAACLIKQKRS